MGSRTTPPAPAASDVALLAASVDDPDAFRELYCRYAERVYRYFQRRTRDDASAQDLTAETFAQAWYSRKRFGDFADLGSAAPWLFGIARNVLLMSLRRGALERRASERLGLRERLDTPGERADAAPDPSWLEGADELLDTLPPDQREAIRLRILDDLDYGEVAARLHITEPAARTRVHRGLKSLRGRVSRAEAR